MSTKGLESVTLRFADSSVASATDSSAVQDSQQALENRLVHGIVMSSHIRDLISAAALSNTTWMCNMQIGFMSQANQPGIIATLMNVINMSLQGAITPNVAITPSAENGQIMFPTPVKWAEGVTISLIVHQFNDTGNSCAMECTATILYTD